MNDRKVKLTDVAIIDFEAILFEQNGSEPFFKSGVTEESTRLNLYYDSGNRHFGTYNRDTCTAWHFAN